jgi:hypothetical protein
VAEGQVLLRVLRFSLAPIIAPTLKTHLHVNSALGKRDEATVPFQKQCSFGNRGALEGKMFSPIFLPFKGLIQPRAVITI